MVCQVEVPRQRSQSVVAVCVYFDTDRASSMIESSRLALSRPVIFDFDESYSMNSNVHVAAYIGGKPASREEAWNKLLRNIGHWNVFGYGIFTVREKRGNSFVGELGFAHFARGLGDAFDPFPEASWVLIPQAHGMGYATEANIAAHDWLARTQRLPRTVCIIHPDNARSLRVAEKLGYSSFDKAQYRDAAPIMFQRRCLSSGTPLCAPAIR